MLFFLTSVLLLIPCSVFAQTLPTARVIVSGNLDPSAEVRGLPMDTSSFSSLGSNSSFSVFVDLRDSKQAVHSVTIYFYHTALNEWTARAYVDAAELGGMSGLPALLGERELTFSGNGTRAGVVPASDISASPAWSNGADVLDISFSFVPLTQLRSSNRKETKVVALSGNVNSLRPITLAGELPVAGSSTLVEYQAEAEAAFTTVVYDALGFPHTLEIFAYHLSNSPNTWQLRVLATSADLLNGSGTHSEIGSFGLTFDGDGGLSDSQSSSFSLAPQWAGGASPGSIALSVAALLSQPSITDQAQVSGNVRPDTLTLVTGVDYPAIGSLGSSENDYLFADSITETFTVVDSLGASHVLRVLGYNVGGNSWDFRLIARGEETGAGVGVVSELGNLTLVFNADGVLINPEANRHINSSVNWTNGSSTQNITTIFGPISQLAANGSMRETSMVSIAGNLDAEAPPLVVAVDYPAVGAGTAGAGVLFNTYSTNASFSTFVDVRDSLGLRHTLTTFFYNNGGNSWDVRVVADGGSITGGTAGEAVELGRVVLDFAPGGNAQTELNDFISAAPVHWSSGATSGNVRLSFSPFTQFASASNISSILLDSNASELANDITVTSLGVNVPSGAVVSNDGEAGSQFGSSVSSIESACGGLCGMNSELDEDFDGVSNCQEIQDETNACDSGSFVERLSSLSCVGVNTFLGQINIASVQNNLSDEDIAFTFELRDTTGAELHSQSFQVAAGQKQDVVLNSLNLSADQLATLCVRSDNSQSAAWSGGLAVYKQRFNSNFGQSFDASSEFDYALFYPFTVATRGEVALPLNTNLLTSSSSAFAANWFYLLDGTPGDSMPLAGVLTAYDIDGQSVAERTIEIADGGRVEIAGHEFIGARAVGSIVFRPDNDSQDFFYAMTRYHFESLSTTPNAYTAFVLPKQKGSTGPATGVIQRQERTFAFVETFNSGAAASTANFRYYSADGSATGTTGFSVSPRASVHTLVDASLLAAESSGSVEYTSGSPSMSPLIVHYVFAESGELAYAYASGFKVSSGLKQRTEFNSYLGQENTAILFNSSESSVSGSVELVSLDGMSLQVLPFTLAPKARTSIRLDVQSNTYGGLKLSADRLGLSSFVHREKQNEYLLPFFGAFAEN